MINRDGSYEHSLREWMERIVSKYYRSSRLQKALQEPTSTACVLLIAETERERAEFRHLPNKPSYRKVRIEGRLEVSF
mgnify:CR=1